MISKIRIYFLFIILLLTFDESNASCVDGEVNYTKESLTASNDCTAIFVRDKEEKTITINSGITVTDFDGKKPLNINKGSAGTTVINNGSLIETRSTTVILVGRNSTVELFENNGTISGSKGIKMVNRTGANANWGHIKVFTNTGTLNQTRDIPDPTDDNAAIWVNVWGKITELNNSGSIRSSWQTINNFGIIENFNNTGTISTDKDDDGTVDNGKAIVNARDTETPASWYEDQSFDKRKIGTLTNSGTIEATVNTIHNTGLIETINNSGNITATGNRAIYNKNENDGRNYGEIDTLINSGTISAGSHAIHNTGTITTITNTGTIESTGSGYSIKNEGAITNLTNSKGASGSTLTYTGTVPTNYNIIINSASDFGKIAFTSITGSLNFNVDSESELAGGTTYSSIMTGISSGSISGQSGSHLNTSTGDRFEWSLENGGDATTWNLVTETAQSITPPTNCSIDSSLPGCTSDDEDIVSTIELGMNNLTNVVNVNFAHMNTYDCDTFGENGICISLGARNTKIKNPNSKTNSLVFVFGKKLSEHYRFAFFHHSNYEHNTPSNFTLRDETPLLGILGVWNQKSDKSGLQVKLGAAHQVKHATIIRKQVGISEQAIGNTTLTAWNLISEFKYNIMYGRSLEISPYFAGRYAEKIQDGYTEEEAQIPITYNDIEDKSLSVVSGLKFKKDFSNKFNIFGSGGIEYDIYHDISNLNPSGISGITSVDLGKDFNRTRPVISLGFNFNITNQKIIRLNAQYEELSYKGMSEKNIYLSYNIGF